MKILSTDDLENVKLVKRIALMAEEDAIETSNFMKYYKIALKRIRFEEQCEERKYWNLLIQYTNFMKETYKKQEERDYLFREYVLPPFLEAYQELKGEILRVQMQ